MLLSHFFFIYVCLLHNVLKGPGRTPHEDVLYILQWCYETAESSQPLILYIHQIVRMQGSESYLDCLLGTFSEYSLPTEWWRLKEDLLTPRVF